MRNIIAFIVSWGCLGIGFAVPARSAILVEDGTTRGRIAADAFELRRSRKVGVGASFLGPTGVAGIVAEINFTPENSFVGGFGMGSDFQAFHLQVKHVFGGSWLSPYASAGLAHWYTTGEKGQMDHTEPGFLGDRMLSDDQLRRGEFHETLIFPTVGLQYNQLSGDFAGTSVFVEVVGLIDIGSMILVPTGSAGFLYYF